MTDQQMRDTDVLVPFENDTMLTVNSPIFIDGVEKVRPRRSPELGEHTDEVLRAAGLGEDEIGRLRAAGTIG